VNVRSNDAFDWLTAALTSFERSIGCLSHRYGMPGAASVIALSISPHALLRS
jgi:hypothetical protein